MPSDTAGMTATEELRYEGKIAELMSGARPPCPNCGSTEWETGEWDEKTGLGFCDRCDPADVAIKKWQARPWYVRWFYSVVR